MNNTFYISIYFQIPGLTTERAYEIRIGSHGNNRSELFEVGFDDPVRETDTELLLQEDTFMDFWINWVTVDGDFSQILFHSIHARSHVGDPSGHLSSNFESDVKDSNQIVII